MNINMTISVTTEQYQAFRDLLKRTVEMSTQAGWYPIDAGTQTGLGALWAFGINLSIDGKSPIDYVPPSDKDKQIV